MSEIVVGLGLSERLTLCKLLLDQRERVRLTPASHAINARAIAIQRMQAIRQRLLGRDGGTSLSNELMVPGAAGPRLLADLEAVRSRSEVEQVAFAVSARGIMNTIRVIILAESRSQQKGLDMGWPPELVAGIDAILAAPGGDELTRMDALLDAAIARGVIGEDLSREASTAIHLEPTVKSSMTAFERQLAAKWSESLKEHNRLVNLINAIPLSDPRSGELLAEYKAYRDEVFAPVDAAHQKELAEKKGAERTALKDVGTRVIDRVLASSHVSLDAAEQWAKAQEITPQAVARLRKIGYPVDKVREDMAGFYRFTSGRVMSVRIHSNGSRRANATNIEAHGKVGTINLDSSFNKRVLWHELAHHLEADPVAKNSAGRYIRRRATSQQPRRLSAITGSSFYKNGEVALEGGFFNPYVGKVYSDGMTEVFSMGIETFSDPELLATRMAKDPETLEFVAGFLSKPVSRMERAHMELREVVLAIQERANEDTEDAVEAGIKRLADSIQIEMTTEFPDWLEEQFSNNYMSTSDNKVVAKFPDVPEANTYLVRGVVRNSVTGRKVNGFKLMRRDGARRLYPTSDINRPKAAMAVAHKVGVTPYDYELEKYALQEAV